MVLSPADRQKRYRERMKAEGVKRYQVMLPQSVAEKVTKLTVTLNCNKSELFTRLVEREFEKTFHQ